MIREGAEADIVVLKQNPLEDITALAKPEETISAVFSRGGLVTD